MPTIRIDDNAYRILNSVKKELKKKGISASYSDAIRWIYGRLPPGDIGGD